MELSTIDCLWTHALDSKHLSSVTDTLSLCNFAKQMYLQMLSTILLLLNTIFLVIATIKIHTFQVIYPIYLQATLYTGQW